MGFTYRKVGGLRFLRIGRLQLSWCVCKPKPATVPSKPADHALVMLDCMIVAFAASLFI